MSITAYGLKGCRGHRDATKVAQFHVAGCLPAVDPVSKWTAWAPSSCRSSALCEAADRGLPGGAVWQGNETLVNKRVRNTLELSPRSAPERCLGPGHCRGAAVASPLRWDWPAEQLEAAVYKLLV